MEIRLTPALGRLDHPHQQRQTARTGRRQILEHLALALDQGRSQQQVPRGVAPQGKLGGEHQVGTAGPGPFRGRQDPPAVALQVAHQGIQLGQGKTHQGAERP